MGGTRMRSLLATTALAASGLVGLGAGSAHAASVIHVPASRPTIQAAIEAASAGDTVVVAPGTYHERIDFKGKAIEVKSSAGPATTVIDGDATGITAVFHTAETRASVLRGFTITDGLQPPMQSQLLGGGIAVKEASPTIVGNIVTANIGSGIGVTTGTPLIQDNVITANTTPWDGGGIWGGLSSEIVGNRIEDNVADIGAGLIVFGTTVVRNNIIRGNRAVGPLGGGGGVTMYGGVVVGNLIADNTALAGDNAMGGGVLWRGGDQDRLLNNTFVGNTSPTGSAIADVGAGTISGNVFHGPAGASAVHCAGPYEATYFQFNDVFNGTASRYQNCGADLTGAIGNVSVDPQFVSATDYRLRPGSPAIDAGDPAVAGLPATDLTGAARITDGDGDGLTVVDMGAYETPALPIVGSRYHPLQPARILDTRIGQGAAGRLGPGATMNLQVTGQGGIPAAGVSAVVLNVTVTEPTAPSFLTAWPAGHALPLAANLNYVAGQTVPNLVTVKVGAGGQVSLYNHAGSTHVVADVSGWYGDAGASSGSRFTSLAPSRILDTRYGVGTQLPANGPGAPTLGPGASADIQVTGLGGVPASGVDAVVLNVTVTEPTAPSFLTAWPAGAEKPWAANLNYVAGQTVPNLVVVKVGDGGKIRLYNNAGSTHVVADVAGWYGADGVPGAAGFTSLVPARMLDTRFGVGAPGALGQGSTLDLQVTGRGGVPASGVSAVVLNVTVTQPTAPSFLTAWPTGSPFPLAANLNYVAGVTVPNLVVVKVGDGGRVSLYNNAGSTHVVADVAGWFSD